LSGAMACCLRRLDNGFWGRQKDTSWQNKHKDERRVRSNQTRARAALMIQKWDRIAERRSILLGRAILGFLPKALAGLRKWPRRRNFNREAII
jgi:hypothetical protein